MQTANGVANKNATKTPEVASLPQAKEKALVPVLESVEIQKTIGWRAERNTQLLHMIERYERSREKVFELKNFISQDDDAGLKLSIQNSQGKTYDFQNIQIIKDVVDFMVKRGEVILVQQEQGILNFEV